MSGRDEKKRPYRRKSSDADELPQQEERRRASQPQEPSRQQRASMITMKEGIQSKSARRQLPTDPSIRDLLPVINVKVKTPSREEKPRSSSSEKAPSSLRLRVAGLGHYCELDMSPMATLSDLKEQVENKTDIPAPYQRLVAKRKKMDDDGQILGPTIMDSADNIEKLGIGLEDRTKILLLHSSLYSQDKEGVEKLNAYIKEINRIDEARKNREMENKVVQELIIQICCKIDCVETNGSDALRKMRKMAVRKAEDVASRSENDMRGIDP